MGRRRPSDGVREGPECPAAPPGKRLPYPLEVITEYIFIKRVDNMSILFYISFVNYQKG